MNGKWHITAIFIGHSDRSDCLSPTSSQFQATFLKISADITLQAQTQKTTETDVEETKWSEIL